MTHVEATLCAPAALGPWVKMRDYLDGVCSADTLAMFGNVCYQLLSRFFKRGHKLMELIEAIETRRSIGRVSDARAASRGNRAAA